MKPDGLYSFPRKITLDGTVGKRVDWLLSTWTKHLPYSAFVSNFSEKRINNFAGGETWGKALRCACLYYRYSQDSELLSIIRRTVHELLACERENGSISCAAVEDQPDGPGGDLWERKYVLLGLSQYLEDVEDDPKVLASMIRQVDCLIDQIGDAPKTPVTRTGWSPNKIESSTILHPVMLLYKRTREPRFMEFAHYLIDQGGCDGYDLIEEAVQGVPPHLMAGGIYPKAYEMMSFFIGGIEYSLETGNSRCRTAALNLFKNISEREITLIGSGGGDAPYHEHGECWGHTAYEQTNPKLHRLQETCVATTWLQFCIAIHRMAGSSICIDQIERTFLNALLGAAKPSGDKFSYMNRLNGIKSDPSGWGVWVPEHGSITCCDLNGPMGMACAKQIVANTRGDDLAINLFFPGRMQLGLASGNLVDLTVESDFPFEGKVRIQLCAETPALFTVSVRIPSWSDRSCLRVDGMEYDAIPGTYTKITREWGKSSEITLDLDLRVKSRLSAKDKRIAIERGPVVFARDENMDLRFDSPVQLAPHSGFIDARIERPFYETVWQQIEIPTQDGSSFRMVDWASICNWNGRRTCTWLPLRPGETVSQ